MSMPHCRQGGVQPTHPIVERHDAMTRILLVVTLLLVAATLALSQMPGKDTSTDEAHIRTLNEASGEAQVKRDMATLDRLLADDFILTRANGVVANKAQNLADVQSGERSFTSYKNDDVRVRLYGDAAVVTGQVVSSGTYKGQDFSGRFRYTKVFVKKDGQWQIVAWQATLMPQQ
jgi:ketosteroid isomerase-like protein